MRKTLLPLILGTALFFTTLPVSAQMAFPSASPRAKVVQEVGLGSVTVDYSRPSIKDRVVFGDLVPFDTVWRTGANAPTTITFSEDLKLQGQAVPAGTYVLLSIPGEKEWTVILNKESDLASINNYNEDQDLLRLKVKPKALEEPVETFTIEVDHLRDDSAHLVLKWEKTAVPLELTLDTKAKVDAAIEQAISSGQKQDARSYASAAQWIINHGGDLEQALAWMELALEERPEAFWWVHGKAQILAKLGRKDEAKAAAEQSIELSKQAPAMHEEYRKRNQQLIESL